MKLIHVVHVQKFNKRHMPDQLHYVGELKELVQQLLGYNCVDSFDSVQQFLGYMTRQDESKDFNLVHSYEQSE